MTVHLDHVPSACWQHTDVEVRNSTIQGDGLFAARPLPAGHQYVDTIAVDEDVRLVLPPNQPIHHDNHSCDPNLWHTDAYTLVTRRAIEVGEELTVDYATQTTEPAFRMSCRCGPTLCRQVVTGTDWQETAWADRYDGHVVPAVARLTGAATP
ncbi:MAG TPA: SET domain-containing protein [Pseudonocardiaceae bacterium]|nr:SET domain-containing protein [Pseudonocardiaceae bacterium]